MRFGFFIWEDFKNEEERLRQKIAKSLRSKPQAFKDYIMSNLLRRIEESFDSLEFGIISVCSGRKSKEKNFLTMNRFIERTKDLKLFPIAHIGFWDYLNARSFFIPDIEMDQIETLAIEYKQKHFIWGEKGHWECFKAGPKKVLVSGVKFKAIQIDEEFIIYRKIVKRKENLKAIMNEIRNNNNRSASKEASVTIKKKISDLEKIENSIIDTKNGI